MNTIFLFVQLIYFFNWTFKLFLGLVGSLLKDRESPKYQGELPKYTILCPMYDETEVVSELVKNLSKLDYPQDKLEVFLLLEEDDKKTQDYITDNILLPENFKVLVVPKGYGPKTKPNACNYGLEKATGEYLVIFDAEDNPEKDQLLKALYEFRGQELMGKKIGAVQARLQYQNEKQNLLSRMFNMEYKVWFTYYLPALDCLGLSIPLGGTSNHFKVDLLRKLGGWNANNVTEDCELGLRLYNEAYTVSVINSTTWEEACCYVWPWIKQRTRWTRGYIQTSVKYLFSKNNLSFIQKIGAWLFILGTPVFNILYIPVNLIYLLNMEQQWFYGLTGQLAFVNMVLGITSLVFIHCLSRRSVFGFLMPFYWTLHSVAGFRALYQYVVNETKWEKTKHYGSKK